MQKYPYRYVMTLINNNAILMGEKVDHVSSLNRKKVILLEFIVAHLTNDC